jgi:tRNA 2-thiouridine synthesizing protein A
MADQTLDCKGMVCPMPIVKITKKTKEMPSGQTLEVLASDRAFEPDIKAWCNRTGNSLDSLAETDGIYTALITLK